MKIYNYLLDAHNCRIVMLTGTPIINYPNEIGVLFNLLRGYTKTWTFPLTIKTSKKINRDFFIDLFESHHFKTYDYLEYSGNKLIITRNPFGFINTKRKSKKGGNGCGTGKRGGNHCMTHTKKRGGHGHAIHKIK